MTCYLLLLKHFIENDFRQISQLKDFSPVCTRMWYVKVLFSANIAFIYENYLATVECYDFGKKYWNVIYLIGGYKALRRVLKFDLQHLNWNEMPKIKELKKLMSYLLKHFCKPVLY